MPKIKIKKNFFVCILNDVATLIEEMTTECECPDCRYQRVITLNFVDKMRELDNSEKERIRKHL